MEWRVLRLCAVSGGQGESLEETSARRDMMLLWEDDVSFPLNARPPGVMIGDGRVVEACVSPTMMELLSVTGLAGTTPLSEAWIGRIGTGLRVAGD
jgi:hypothetical protein